VLTIIETPNGDAQINGPLAPNYAILADVLGLYCKIKIRTIKLAFFIAKN